MQCGRRRRGRVLRWCAGLATLAALVACTADPAPAPDQPSSTPATTPTPAPETTSGQFGSEGTVNAPTTPADSGTPVATTTQDDEPEIPEVVQLPWLSKPASGGVETVVDDDIHWQGTVPGEHATITDDAYRWFGADGSMVACSAPGTCLGIDADGFLAVVPDSTTRLVYAPDGTKVGRFRADGRPVAGTVPGLAKAVQQSGVDLAGLLDEATRTVPFAGGITGDPHVLTAGGQRYTTQLTGEYHARTGDPGRQLQVRLEPLPHQPDVSVVTAAVLGINGTVFEYHSDGSATLDGQVLATPDPFLQQSIAGVAELGLWSSDDNGTLHAAVVWPDQSAVVLAASPDLGMTVVVQAPATSGISGLFGVGGADPANDLQDRQGAPLDVETVVRNWEVDAGESLFSDRVEPTPGFPSAAVTPPAAASGFAEDACRDAGVSDRADLTACGFDVGLTGDAGFAAGHGAMATLADRRVADAVTERWPAMVVGADESQELPELIEADLAAGQQQTFALTVAKPGVVGLEFLHGCGSDPAPYPDRADSAVRVFDAVGRAVSSRLHTCGQPETPELAPGQYRLVLAGPATGDPVDLRLEVKLP